MGIADGKHALIVGVANDKSLAWAIAQELKAQGAEIAWGTVVMSRTSFTSPGIIKGTLDAPAAR